MGNQPSEQDIKHFEKQSMELPVKHLGVPDIRVKTKELYDNGFTGFIN